MASKSLMSWASQVVEILKSKNPSLFEEAIEAAEEEYDDRLDEVEKRDALTLLEWLRGDEPEDCFEASDSEEEYADFLIEEWKLFGPLGE